MRTAPNGRLGGRFITLEGGEGAGKSTLARALKQRLEASGERVYVTREPGGSPGAEMVRHVLLSGAARPLGPFAEALLFAAARSDHVEQAIRPALARGETVLCDRFIDSTRAYQGSLGKVNVTVIDAMERLAIGPTMPDLTLIIDIDPAIGLKRAAARNNGADRFEAEDIGFHRQLREAFLSIAKANAERCVVIDGALPAARLADTAWQVIEQHFTEPPGAAR